MRLFIAGIGAIGLILFMAFVASRLVRSRRAGISIRMQVFLALAGSVGAFALGLGLLVVDRISARATLLAEEAARAEATAVASLVAAELEAAPAHDDALAVIAERLASQRGDATSFALLDGEQKPLLVSEPPAGSPGTVSVTSPITVSGLQVGVVQVVKPTIVVERALADFAPTVLLISLVLGAAAAASAALIGRTIAAPIEGLTDFAERVSEGNRRGSPPPAHGREVQRLTQAIDSMRRQLQGRPFVEAFAADLSHELKNPVAAIRASAEVLADGALDEPEEARRFVGRIQESTARIEELLSDLLSLARIEARGVEEMERVELAGLLREVVADRFESEVGVDVQSQVTVRGDRTWLRRAIDNLIDNAVQHGEPGPVSVSLAREDARAVVVVEQPGRVPTETAPKLFRRFVTSRADRGGTGLGLAIVRAVAEAHGGSVRCEEQGPPVVRFCVELPVA